MANLNINKVILGGRLTADPEIKALPSGMSIATFSIAINRKNDKEKADFINLKAFGKTADSISKFFRKGSCICVVGNIQINNWQDKDGNKRYSTDVVVDEFYFVDSKNEVAAPTLITATPPLTPKFEEIDINSELPF